MILKQCQKINETCLNEYGVSKYGIINTKQNKAQQKCLYLWFAIDYIS